MKKHYKFSPEEREQHDMAVKIRKMTDQQIVEFINDLQNDSETAGKKVGVEEFLSRLCCMSGTGNGIGQGTVAKIQKFASEEGYLGV
jgi:hypothetical protein